MNVDASAKTDTALISGASSGIGLALAREFARHGHPLVIVAPFQAELEYIAVQLRNQFAVAVRAIAIDLNDEGAAEQLFNTLMDEGIGVEILVNNAGLGQRGNFWETPLERDIEIIRVNVETPIRLTKCFLPSMVARRHGRILNTAVPTSVFKSVCWPSTRLRAWSRSSRRSVKSYGSTKPAIPIWSR